MESFIFNCKWCGERSVTRQEFFAILPATVSQRLQAKLEEGNSGAQIDFETRCGSCVGTFTNWKGRIFILSERRMSHVNFFVKCPRGMHSVSQDTFQGLMSSDEWKAFEKAFEGGATVGILEFLGECPRCSGTPQKAFQGRVCWRNGRPKARSTIFVRSADQL